MDTPLSALMSRLGTGVFQVSYVQSINDIFIVTAIITIWAILPVIILRKE
jgi:hypothetical protein